VHTCTYTVRTVSAQLRGVVFLYTLELKLYSVRVTHAPSFANGCCSIQ